MSNTKGSVAALLVITATLAFLIAPHVAGQQKPPVEAITAPQKPILNPALKPICTCESGQDTGQPQQYNIHTGGVLHGKQNPKDIGACQINDYWNGRL